MGELGMQSPGPQDSTDLTIKRSEITGSPYEPGPQRIALPIEPPMLLRRLWPLGKYALSWRGVI